MLVIVNDIQMLTAKWQTDYYALMSGIKVLNQKLTMRPELYSSFFYSFLFCVFVLSVDCLGGLGGESCKWLKNVVLYMSCTSFAFWAYIWIYYICTIKNMEPVPKAIAYEFNLWRSILVIVGVNILLPLIEYYLTGVSKDASHCLYAFSLIVIACVPCYYSIRRNERSVFTLYFILIHFMILLAHSLIYCSIQEYVLSCPIGISEVWVSGMSVLFALFSGLLFPLFIPFFRIKYEVNKSARLIPKIEKEYEKNIELKNKELNQYFEILRDINTLSAFRKKVASPEAAIVAPSGTSIDAPLKTCGSKGTSQNLKAYIKRLKAHLGHLFKKK